jgi:glutamyl-tRNA reductase
MMPVRRRKKKRKKRRLAKEVEAIIPEETISALRKGTAKDITEFIKAIRKLAKGKVRIKLIEILPDKTIKLFVKGARKDIIEFSESISASIIAGLIVLAISITFLRQSGAILLIETA